MTPPARELEDLYVLAAHGHHAKALRLACIALACGFWLGYAALARRIREKFGGIKVY